LDEFCKFGCDDALKFTDKGFVERVDEIGEQKLHQKKENKKRRKKRAKSKRENDVDIQQL
jgi:hypothetical protein